VGARDLPGAGALSQLAWREARPIWSDYNEAHVTGCARPAAARDGSIWCAGKQGLLMVALRDGLSVGVPSLELTVPARAAFDAGIAPGFKRLLRVFGRRASRPSLGGT